MPATRAEVSSSNLLRPTKRAECIDRGHGKNKEAPPTLQQPPPPPGTVNDSASSCFLSPAVSMAPQWTQPPPFCQYMTSIPAPFYQLSMLQQPAVMVPQHYFAPPPCCASYGSWLHRRRGRPPHDGTCRGNIAVAGVAMAATAAVPTAVPSLYYAGETRLKQERKKEEQSPFTVI